jgi:hypothetical protein
MALTSCPSAHYVLMQAQSSKMLCFFANPCSSNLLQIVKFMKYCHPDDKILAAMPTSMALKPKFAHELKLMQMHELADLLTTSCKCVPKH